MKQAFVAVKDFDRFQHYKTRTPPWIKLYNSLLDDYRFIGLPDAARGQLLLIWLIASRHRNRIPNDAKYITQAIHCSGRLQLDALLASGFLFLTNETASDALADNGEGASKDASKPQATSPQNATLEGEREAELETETETTTSPARALSFLAQLLQRVPDVRPWRAEVDACIAGMAGHHRATPEQIERAARDMLANGVTSNPNIRQFRRYIEGAVGEDQPRPNGARASKLSHFEQSLLNSRKAFGEIAE